MKMKIGCLALLMASTFVGGVMAQGEPTEAEPFQTIEVAAANVSYFDAIDSSLGNIWIVVNRCRGETSEEQLDACVCKEGGTIARMDNALTNAIRQNPQWAGAAISHGGKAFDLTSLKKRTDEVRKACS